MEKGRTEMAAVSDEIDRLLRTVFEPPSLLDRLRGKDARPASLALIAASGEFRVVPALLPVLAADHSVSPHAARAIAHLLRGIGPAQLAWLDVQCVPVSTCTPRTMPGGHSRRNESSI